MTTGLMIVCALALLAAVIVPLIACRHVVREMHRELDEFAENVNAHLEAPAKMLEVRDFHEEMNEWVLELLAEARRRKDRRLLERGQRMRERLETLRARVLVKTSNLLSAGEPTKGRKRRK